MSLSNYYELYVHILCSIDSLNQFAGAMKVYEQINTICVNIIIRFSSNSEAISSKLQENFLRKETLLKRS